MVALRVGFDVSGHGRPAQRSKCASAALFTNTGLLADPRCLFRVPRVVQKLRISHPGAKPVALHGELGRRRLSTDLPHGGETAKQEQDQRACCQGLWVHASC